MAGAVASSLSQGAAMSRQQQGFIVPPEEVRVLLGRVFGFNHKIIIKIQKSPPSIMVTKNLWSMRV